jgi:hypothetical protein
MASRLGSRSNDSVREKKEPKISDTSTAGDVVEPTRRFISE